MKPLFPMPEDEVPSMVVHHRLVGGRYILCAYCPKHDKEMKIIEYTDYGEKVIEYQLECGHWFTKNNREVEQKKEAKQNK